MENVLASRYASPELVDVWSAENKVRVERRFWLAVLAAQADHGLDVPAGALDAYREAIDRVDLASIRRREERTRHDVKARIEEFDDLAGFQLVHAGMTSRDLTENVEQFQMMTSVALLRRRAVAVLARLAEKADEHADVIITGRTHNVPAQITTLGKRWATIGEELLIAIEALDGLVGSYPFRGLKGAVGTQQDMIDLVGRDAVAQVETQALESLGAGRLFSAVGQVYPRSLDFAIVAAFVRLAAAPANLGRLVRLMAGHELLTEGFRDGQVGSSAMPHKMNPRSAERIGALTAVLSGHLTMANELSGDQWNEGDVSCSVVRRVVLPDACFALDGILQTALAVLEELAVHRPVIDHELDRYLPFLATGRVLAAGVRAGVGREDAHEIIKGHAVEAARSLRNGGAGGPELIERLVNDERLPLDEEAVRHAVSAPEELIGAATEQIDSFRRRALDVVASDPGAADVRAYMAV